MKTRILGLVFAAVLLSLGSCGGGTTLPAPGSVVQLSLTDAPGDFYSYVVDITSIQLKRIDGATVEVLPATTRVDLAEYVSLAEVLATRSVPPGEYTSVILTVDYTNASIVVPDGSGAPIPANPVDTGSAPLTTLVMTLDLGPNDHFHVGPGVATHIALDFDLAASNSVDNSTNPATVTVQPVLYANGVINDRLFRVAGVLDTVDQDNHVLVMDLRPFDRHIGTFGRAGVTVTALTHYQVNGQEFIGDTGLNALLALTLPTPMVAFGTVSTITHGLVAALVAAGDQVRGPLDDVMRGVVVARSGNTLTVLGLLVDHGQDEAEFGATMTLNMSAVSSVFKSGTGLVSSAAVSVGSVITALGTHDTGSGNSAHMNAQRARITPTPFGGTVVQASPLVVNVQRIAGVPVARFNFAGTGTTGSSDADPANYEVDTGSLSLTGITASDPIRVLGFPATFGTAPPDFTATTLVNASQMPAVMGISWQAPGSAAPFTTISSTGFVVDMTSPTDPIGALHHVVRDGIVTDLNTFAQDVTVDGATLGRYAIATPTSIEAFGNFADFSSALTTHLNGGDKLRLLGTRGRFDNATVTDTAPGAAAVMQ